VFVCVCGGLSEGARCGLAPAFNVCVCVCVYVCVCVCVYVCVCVCVCVCVRWIVRGGQVWAGTCV